MTRHRRELELTVPIGGLDRRHGYQQQPPYTTPDALNVRPDGAIEGRERLGRRPGLAKVFSTALGSGNPVRLLDTVRWVDSGIKNATLASANGAFAYEASAGAWTTVSASPALATDRQIFGAEHQQKFYVADDTLRIFDPSVPSVSAWTASSGSLPTNCTLCKMWRDRIVLSGDADTPHLWYMSAAGDPRNWDYGATGALRAVAATNANAGAIGEPVTCLAPFTDDCMIFGCTSSLWTMRGDPAARGTIDNISREIGILSGSSYCWLPNGAMVFLSLDGLYLMEDGCGSKPISISREKMPEELLNIDVSSTTVSLAYDVRSRGVHIFLVTSSQNTHWWLDWETQSYWPVQMPEDQEPTYVHARRDLASAESVVYLGGRDGWVRHFKFGQAADVNANDSTTAVTDYVDLGPLRIARGGMEEGIVAELAGTPAAESGAIDWELRVGPSAEEAYDGTVVAAGSWPNPGYSHVTHPRVRGGACVLRIKSGGTTKWALEKIDMALHSAGRKRV